MMWGNSDQAQANAARFITWQISMRRKAAYGTKGEFAAMQGNGPVPGVLLTLLARSSYSGS
jgi:hypothetical protein